MRDSIMVTSSGALVVDGSQPRSMVQVLDRPFAQDSENLMSELVVEELDSWWGAPLAPNTETTCRFCTVDPQVAEELDSWSGAPLAPNTETTCRFSTVDPQHGPALALAGDLA